MPYNEFGEIIPDNSGGSRNRNPPPPEQPESNFNGWWIVAVIILIFIGYQVVSNWGNDKSNQVVKTQQEQPNQTTNTYQQQSTYTPPNSNNNANPYGNGNGKLTLYKTCNYCPDLSVSIDGEYVGTLTQTLSSASCDDYGTVNKILSSGNHTITGKDSYGTTYDGTAYVYEGECTVHSFTKSNDVKPNPYGSGNGKLTFYKTCNYCPDLEIYVDRDYVGTLNQTLNSASCDDFGTISKVLSTGNHTITGKDSYGTTYNGTAYVYEGECSVHPFTKSNDVKPNPYGIGNGQVTIYHNCSNCNNVQVSVDGYYVGTLTKYYQSGSPICGTQSYGGTVVKNLSAGSHNITAKDDYGNTWSGYVYITESSCKTYSLENFRQGNPYGYGKGLASFWTDKNAIYDLYIDGYFQNSIRQYFLSGEPDCGQKGTVSIILSEGSHSYSAKDGRGEWQGTFYVTAGQCVNIKVNRY